MRTRLRSKISLLFMTFGLLLAVPAVALADNIQDNITDNVASSLQLTAGDANSDKTAEIKIIGNNAMMDPDSGCNFDTATESLTLSFNTPTGVTATALDGATATPGQMKFTACGVDQTVKFSASSSAVAGNYTVTANIVNNATDGTFFNQVSIPITVNAPADTTPPEISYVLDPASPDGNNGWYKSDVSLTWTVVENESPDSLVTTGCEDQNITADQDETTYSCSATSDGGSAGPVDVPIKRDATPPTNIQFSGGGLSDGASYDFGDVPAGPTSCSADDATSGFASCDVDGYSDTVGDQEVTATATDNAGNSATNTLSYSVVGWTLKGFYPPVDMGIHNTMKGGQTVALKFEVFKTLSGAELTDTSVIKTFTQKVNCTTSGGVDAVEDYATGNTTLRYDTTSGQFIFNWKSPKSPGTCYRVTMTTQDGSSISADFTLK